MRKQLGVDLVFLASGSIRKESLGPIITMKDFLEVFPFEDGIISFNMTGAQLRKVMKFLMREEAFDPDAHCEWYQISGNFFCEYDRGTGEILTLAVYVRGPAAVLALELVAGSGHRVHHVLVDSPFLHQSVKLSVDRRNADRNAARPQLVQDLPGRHMLLFIFLQDRKDLVPVF